MDPRPAPRSFQEESPGRERTRPARRSRGVPRYRTDELLGASPCAVIEHRGIEYRLHVTRLGKLILTK